MENTKEAFHWIIGVLKRYDVPFQITGGLAAKIYGSPRPLNDFDIDVPDERLREIVLDVRPYIVFGPAHHRDERWDILLMTLEYKGQEIDIDGGYGIKICDARTGKLVPVPTDFSHYEEREIFGLKVPVIPREDLIAYKRMLVGEHQQVDIQSVEASLSRR
ncbi:MAG: hypothetical protein WC613_01830 [Candidatus Aenigmatarchaeota archaeon]